MNNAHGFFQSIVESLNDHIVVIDKDGRIKYVSPSWISFSVENDSSITDDWEGVNYIDACVDAARMGDKSGRLAADGIKDVVKGNQETFYFEYPCHSQNEKRWFMMRITPLANTDPRYFVISHQNITERKKAEEQVRLLSNLDGLTNLANRRLFDEFLSQEWRRCARLNKPLSLIMLDIDHFKLYNDTYGHLAGDDCLKRIADVLTNFGKRPTDLIARFGGEEFAVILGNTDIAESGTLAESMLTAIRDLGLPHRSSPTANIITASFGVTSLLPTGDSGETDMIHKADVCLYRAKESGRNQIVVDGH